MTFTQHISALQHCCRHN